MKSQARGFERLIDPKIINYLEKRNISTSILFQMEKLNNMSKEMWK
jgi:hypothetical protein